MIVDTSAVIAILKGEPGHESLTKAILADPDPRMSAATAVELYAVADIRGQPAQRRRIDALLTTLRIRLVPFDETQAQIARNAYSDFGRGSGHPAKLNLGDCFSYALAAHTGEPLLFVGDDFTTTDLQPALGGA
jgi:ribonuclease VapC